MTASGSREKSSTASVRQRMSDDSKRFTVNDRRLFTREGEKREAEDSPPPPAPEAAARPAPAPPAPHPDDDDDLDPMAPGDPGRRQLDFTGLLLSLGAQASVLLTGDPRGGPDAPGPDLAGARAVISLLEVLKDKTEGRRTAEEDEVLQSLLYELRMGYVAVSRAGGA
jgi:hypothetical protein